MEWVLYFFMTSAFLIICGWIYSKYRIVAMELKQVRDDENKLRRAYEASDHANKTKSEFLANVTHELRSPIGAILGYAELLKSHELSEVERYSHVQSIIRNGLHLLHIVNDILDLSKIEAGLLEIEKVTFSLHLELLNIVATYKKEASRRGLKINVSYDFPIPECIVSDPTRFRQIMINLISNAIKFTEQGEISLTVGISKTESGSTMLVIRVKDTGIGINDDQKIKLFQPFMQADASISRKFGGTGLGLSLSRRIAKTLGGDLILELSEIGKGSVFLLTIDPGDLNTTRWIKAHGELNSLPLPTIVEKEESSLENIRVLIVEDSKDNQTIYLQYLESAGAKVDLADDGIQGYRKAMEIGYDVVLMDIQMPVEDGYTTTKRLRESGYTGSIIALTANAMKGERERCINSGCDDYLTKPVDPDMLIEIISWIAKGNDGQDKIKNLRSMNYLSSISQEKLLEVRSIYENDMRVSGIIGDFINSLDSKVTRIKSAIQESDFKQVSSLAHNLRGSSATYGFPEMAALAEKLELESRLEPPDKKNVMVYVDGIRSLALRMAAK